MFMKNKILKHEDKNNFNCYLEQQNIALLWPLILIFFQWSYFSGQPEVIFLEIKLKILYSEKKSEKDIHIIYINIKTISMLNLLDLERKFLIWRQLSRTFFLYFYLIIFQYFNTSILQYYSKVLFNKLVICITCAIHKY